MVETIAVTKDSEHERPVPTAWRPIIREIVRALSEGDYRLSRGIEAVALRDSETAEEIRSYVEDYGETLDALPEMSWESSIAQWEDPHWEVLVDLWTVESGDSDMVLFLRVDEAGSGFRYLVKAVYVP